MMFDDFGVKAANPAVAEINEFDLLVCRCADRFDYKCFVAGDGSYPLFRYSIEVLEARPNEDPLAGWTTCDVVVEVDARRRPNNPWKFDPVIAVRTLVIDFDVHALVLGLGS